MGGGLQDMSFSDRKCRFVIGLVMTGWREQFLF